MGSYLSTPDPDTTESDSTNPDENKIPIMLAKFPAPTSSMIGWTYCLIYPANEENVHQMEFSTMGVLYRSAWPFLETHYLKYLDLPTYYHVYKPTLEGVRAERIKFTPLTDLERAHMKKVIDGEVEYI